MLQQFIAIFLVLGLLAGTLMLLRRKGLAQFSTALPRSGNPRSGNKEKQMQVLERIPLTAQHSLHLVNVRNSIVLIGLSPSGCNKIAEFGPADSATGLTGQQP